MLIANLLIAGSTSSDLWCAQPLPLASYLSFSGISHINHGWEGGLVPPAPGSFCPLPCSHRVLQQWWQLPLIRALGKQLIRLLPAAWSCRRGRQRERERERKRGGGRGLRAENLHPCGGQPEGATAFALTLTGLSFLFFWQWYFFSSWSCMI